MTNQVSKIQILKKLLKGHISKKEESYMYLINEIMMVKRNRKLKLLIFFLII